MTSKKLWTAIVAVVVIVLGVWIFGTDSSESSDVAESNSVYDEMKEVQPSKATGKINGHDYVDLGLSVKWATCNIGATSPGEFGDFYAWGETSTKETYTKENSLTMEKTMEYLAGNRKEDPSTWGKTMKDIAGDSIYDVARVKWKGTWRLPKKKEMNELAYKCKFKWGKINGYEGVLITGPNGNNIFLPASGTKQGSELYCFRESGRYWGATPGATKREACSISFSTVDTMHSITNSIHSSYSERYNGYNIRPVSE